MARALDGASLHANELNDDDLAYEDDLLEDGLATGPAVPSAVQRLASIPAPTQDVDDNDGASEHGHDDREMEHLKNLDIDSKDAAHKQADV